MLQCLEPKLDVSPGFIFAPSCYRPVQGRVCFPVVGVEAPIFGSKLQYEVGGTGVLLLGEELLSIPLQELSTRKCTLWCCLSLVV